LGCYFIIFLKDRAVGNRGAAELEIGWRFCLNKSRLF